MIEFRTTQDAADFFSAFNLVAAGAASGRREWIAMGLAIARKFPNREVYRACRAKADRIGWPRRKRPNGLYL